MIDLLANWVLKNTDGDEKALQRVLTARAGGKWEGATPVKYIDSTTTPEQISFDEACDETTP